MIRPFCWGVIFGAGALLIYLHNAGWIVRDAPPAQESHIGQRFVHSPGECEIDWPQFATVCHHIDSRGNHIVTTGW